MELLLHNLRTDLWNLDYWFLSDFSVAFFHFFKLFSHSLLGFLFRSLRKQVWVLPLPKNRNHWIFFNTIIQAWVLLKPMVLEGTFLFTIHGFRDIKRLRWLIWLIIHGYSRQGATTSTLDLFSRISSIAILLLLLWLLLRLLQLVTWFEEKTNFFLFGTRHFQLFTRDNQKIIRWL